MLTLLSELRKSSTTVNVKCMVGWGSVDNNIIGVSWFPWFRSTRYLGQLWSGYRNTFVYTYAKWLESWTHWTEYKIVSPYTILYYFVDPSDFGIAPACCISSVSRLSVWSWMRSSEPPIDFPLKRILGNVLRYVNRVRSCLITFPSSGSQQG